MKQLTLKGYQINEQNLKTGLAGIMHANWLSWMEYLLSKSIENKDGTITIPKDQLDKWKEYMYTFYSDLPREEQDKFMMDANNIVDIMHGFGF